MTVIKTEAGHQVLKDRSVPLTPRQRSAFIMVDGKRSLQEFLAATAAMGVSPEDVQHLFDLGLLAEGEGMPSSAPAPLGTLPPEVPPPSGRSAQDRYQDAYQVARQLTANLGLRGFRLNLAVEGATNLEQLLAVAPKIRDAVGPEKYTALDRALNG